jgi:hypothetical protein
MLLASEVIGTLLLVLRWGLRHIPNAAIGAWCILSAGECIG